MVKTQRSLVFVTRSVMLLLFNINENSVEVKTMSKYIFEMLLNMPNQNS